MIVEVQTIDGPIKVRVCDYCKSACIPKGRFCSSRCYWQNQERLINESKQQEQASK